MKASKFLAMLEEFNEKKAVLDRLTRYLKSAMASPKESVINVRITEISDELNDALRKDYLKLIVKMITKLEKEIDSIEIN